MICWEKNHLIRYLSGISIVLAAMFFYQTAAADYVRIRGTVVNVRQGPGTTHPVLFQAEQGEEFDLIQTEGLWCLIKLDSGQEAWVFGKLVNIIEGTRPGTPLSDEESQAPEAASSSLSGPIKLGIILSFILLLLVAFLKRRGIIRYTSARLQEISGYKRDQAFRYDNRKPSDDSWEL